MAQKNQLLFGRFGGGGGGVFAQHTQKIGLPIKLNKTTLLSNDDITIFAYEDLKLGQIIKDPDLLKLILKALKWSGNCSTMADQLDLLKNANFQDVLTNPDLLQDEDLMQLLGPYTNRDPTLMITRLNGNNNCDISALCDDSTVTEMEVGVDPELFFPYDDDETRSAEEQVTNVRDDKDDKDDTKPCICLECSQVFAKQSELDEHIKVRHTTTVTSCSPVTEAPTIAPTTTTTVISTPKPTKKKTEATAKNTVGKLVNTIKIKLPTKIKREDTKKSSVKNDNTHNLLAKRTRKKPTTTKFTCNVCGKRLSTKGNLKVHLDTHKPKGKFTCEKCGRM